MLANRLSRESLAVSSSVARRVLIVGLNVAVQQRDGLWYGSAPHWKIMEIFYQNLLSCQFGAIRVFDKTGRSVYDLALEKDLDVLLLNESPYLGLGRIRETPRVYHRLLRVVSNADYVYVRFPSWVGLAAWRCARWLGKPYWLSVHGDWSQILKAYMTGSKSALARIYYKFNHQLAVQSQQTAMAHARCVFFVGEELCRRLHPAHVPTTIYQDVIHLAGDVWEPCQRPLRTRVTLLFVGEISRAKGVGVLLEAVAHLAHLGYSLKLILVGQGPEIETLKRQTIPNVELDVKGWMSHGESFDRLFREADALVLPSFSEGVPRVVLEAMVRATPIIATRVGSIPDVLGQGTRGWLVDAGDAQGIASAVEDLLSNESIRLAKLEAAASYVRTYDKSYWMRVIWAQLKQIDPGLVVPVNAAEDCRLDVGRISVLSR